MAASGGDVPSFEGLLDSNQPKDTEVVIKEEPTSAAPSQQRPAGTAEVSQDTADTTTTLHAHWVVLWSLSSYFRTKLERWSGNDDAIMGAQQQDAADQQPQQRPHMNRLELLVPAGQLELGRRLITAMYSSSPDLSDLEPPQLMQLVALADCYGIGKVVTAAAGQLNKLAVNTMSLETAAAVFDLPAACLRLEALQTVTQTAADKLQQELGDLEAAWGNQRKQQQLLSLPLNALLVLLKDDRTRVASEDTAVYSATRWWEEHHDAGGRAEEVTAVLRLPHCTPTFLSCEALCASNLLREGGLTALLHLQLCAMLATNSARRTNWLNLVCQHMPSWQLPPRPMSSPRQLTIHWELPLSELKEAIVKQAIPNNEPGYTYLYHPSVVWHGREWDLGLCVGQKSDCWLFIGSQCSAACNVQLLVRHTSGVTSEMLQDVYLGGTGAVPIQGRMMFYLGDHRPECGKWPQVVQVLREQLLLHPGDKLHLGCVVTEVA